MKSNRPLKKYFSVFASRSLAVIASVAKQSRYPARDKLRNLGFKEINNLEIAASQKTLLAMTFRDFFSKLLKE